MKTILLTIFYSLNSSYLLADEIKCSGYNPPSTPSSLENLVNDCALQKNLASDPLVQQEHRKKVYEKLADKLANQIKQNSQNVSILTTFYNANGQDLLMNSKDVAQNCRLDSIKAVETCGGKNPETLANKLSLLKSKLPTNKNTPFSNDQSLYGIMAGKFYSDLGMNDKTDSLQCPLERSSGSFMLKSQLDEVSAGIIIQSVNENGVNNQIFDQYPQFKIIQNTKDPTFINKFLAYIKNKPADKKAKEYLNNFFFDPQNQQKLAPALASQCNQITQNLNEFLCSDLTELGSLDDNASKNLFNKLNTTEPMEDQYEVDFTDSSVLTAYGLQCIAKEKKLNPNNNAKNEHSIDQWYNDFTKNIREEDSQQSGGITVDLFCSLYTCKSEEVKQQNSCKNGGPLSSTELKKSFGCDISSQNGKCSTDTLKSIAYMESLEKLKKDSKDQVASSSTSSSSSSSSNPNSKDQKIVSGRLPNFAENYFGVEGSLKALGKPVTPYQVAEKKQDFAEKKLVTADPVYTAPGATPAVKAPKNVEPVNTASDNSSVRPSYTPSQMTQTAPRPSTNTQSSFVETASASSSASKAKAQKPVEADSSPESSRLRDEMEKMIADIKNTKAEIETTKQKIDYPDGFTELGGMGSSNAAAPVNRAEQERLKRLEQSLNDKANRLEEYRRELDNRNFAQIGDNDSARNPSSGATGVSGAGSAGSGGSMGASGGGSGSASAAKLTAGAAAKADGKNGNSAAIIQSGVESSPLTVDELSHLSPENLKKLGIDSSKPFTLKVTFENQTYQVPVKAFIYKGSNILGPIMDPKNKNLNDFLLKSPLFKQYMDYRYEKEKSN